MTQTKSSFDRFGDDLTELIVSYLSFEDKLRLECLSKQFRRLVFNKQFSLELFYTDNQSTIKSHNLSKLLRRVDKYEYKVKTKALESVLKKCPNIRRIEIGRDVNFNEEGLSMIGELCPRLNSIKFIRSIIDIHLSFAKKYGHKLEEIAINPPRDERMSKKFLEYCPNLEKISLYSLTNFNDYKDFSPKLQTINFLSEYPTDVQKFKNLCQQYSNEMKSINVSFNTLTDEEVKTCLLSISHLKNLKELKIHSHYSGFEEPFVEYISMIGQNCEKILSLTLSQFSFTSVPITDHFSDTLSSSKSIKSFIFLSQMNELKGSVKSLHGCKQLKHLCLKVSSMNEDFFSGIDTALPNLQTLELIIHKFNSEEISDSLIEPFLTLKFIQKVEVKCIHKYINQWYFGKQYNDMKLAKKKIISITNNCGLIKQILN